MGAINSEDDRYRTERHLGEGGMASVYLAEDLLLFTSRR